MILFDVKQFEQFFKDGVLKKGLRLFEKGALEFVKRLPDFEYQFVVDEHTLYLQKRGDKLIHYSCSCVKTAYCEHLAAVLFHFQQEALGIKIKSQNKKSNEVRSLRISDREENLRKTQFENLIHFIKERKKEPSKKELADFLLVNPSLSLLDVYCMELETSLQPYLQVKKLDQVSIYKMEKVIQSFIKSKKENRSGDSSCITYLAVVCAFIPLFNLRYGQDESSLFTIYRDSLNALNNAYNKGLDKTERQEWFKATLKSVESNKSLHCEAYVFLIPRFVTNTKSERELFVLGNVLQKRSYKIPYTSQVDKLLMVRLEVALREWKLFNIAFPLHYEGIEVELIFAKAELYFCKNKNKAAFELLEKEYQSIRIKHKHYYNDYLNYILSNAERTGNKEVEIKYLRESFLRRLFIVPQDLDRFMNLFSDAEGKAEIAELIRSIKTNTNGYYFEKISLLLLRANLLDDLITELSRQNNKFQLIHEVALKKFPDYNPGFLTLYMRHLLETLRQDSIYMYQMKVFTTAKEFLDRLPENLVIELIKKLLDQIGKTGHLYRYINELYDYPFLKEEGNY